MQISRTGLSGLADWLPRNRGGRHVATMIGLLWLISCCACSIEQTVGGIPYKLEVRPNLGKSSAKSGADVNIRVIDVNSRPLERHKDLPIIIQYQAPSGTPVRSTVVLKAGS